MTKSELMNFVGKKVILHLKYKKYPISGVLFYCDEFSKKYDYRSPHYFFIGDYSFLVSHVKKVKII